MKIKNITGLENAPKIMQDFVLSLNNTKIKKSFIMRNRDKIIQKTQPIYRTIVFFIFCSIVLTQILEVLYA
jgi:hypothetical protein